MTTPIYVDQPRKHNGKIWCHMFSADLDALDAFALQIGVSSYRQVPPAAKWPHYDLTMAARDRALAAGAVEADRFKLVEISNIARRRWELDRLPLLNGAQR